MKNHRIKRFVTLAVGTAVLAAPLLASANMDIGSVATHVSSNYSSLSKLLTGGAYVIGAGGIIHGLHTLWQKSHDQGGQIKTSKIAIPIIAGGGLIAVAVSAGVPVATLFGTGASNGSDSGTTSY